MDIKTNLAAIGIPEAIRAEIAYHIEQGFIDLGNVQDAVNAGYTWDQIMDILCEPDGNPD